MMKGTRKDTDQVVVAVLCSNLSMGKKISEIFKKVGVHPYICTSLSQFWTETLEEAPHLALVDVNLMSEGRYLFKNHPLIENQTMPVAFFFEPDSEALLYSTYDILNLGYINSQISLSGQIKSVLKRFNSYQSWQSKAVQESNEKDLTERKLSKVVEKIEELKEINFYENLLNNLEARLEAEKDSEDFYSAVARVLSGVREFKKFTFLELSPSGQKLISPKFYFDKYVEIPSLWLGKTCTKGIEFFAQNMGSQVCLEMMGGELMSLMVKGRREDPEVMVFVQVEGEEFLGQFNWEAFERSLSGVFCHFGWRLRKDEGAVQSLGQSWELFHRLDEIKFGALPESRYEGGYDRYALVSIQFDDLVECAFKQKDMRFYWKKFYQDFLAGLETQKNLKFLPFYHNLRDTFLLVEKENLDHDFVQIKDYCQRFSYWRYFEDSDVILGASLKPEVCFAPMAPEAIERIANRDESFELNKIIKKPAIAKNSAKQINYFRPGPEQSM